MTASVGWLVVTGPDRSHMIDATLHPRLREARQHYDRLQGRPRQIWRHMWEHPYSTAGGCRLIAEDGCRD